jgi:hypothetical protein
MALTLRDLFALTIVSTILLLMVLMGGEMIARMAPRGSVWPPVPSESVSTSTVTEDNARDAASVIATATEENGCWVTDYPCRP